MQFQKAKDQNFLVPRPHTEEGNGPSWTPVPCILSKAAYLEKPFKTLSHSLQVLPILQPRTEMECRSKYLWWPKD